MEPKNDTKTPADNKESINIKKEDSEILRPMSYYIDDRIELARQIFSTLKPKTILNCAPNFLKELEFKNIEERCIDELLGISKKRLNAAINATRCPFNTDSSNDSAPEQFDDYISLEEISSDSSCATSKTDTDNKKTSVLELIELQARARAIRSQLALEPITKVEVDSDVKNYGNSSNSDNNKSAGSGEELENVRTQSNNKPETVASKDSSLTKNSNKISALDSSSSKNNFFQPTNLFFGQSEENPEKNVDESLKESNINLNENINKEQIKSKAKKKSKRNFRNNHDMETLDIDGSDFVISDKKQKQLSKSTAGPTHLDEEGNKLRGRSSSEDVVTIIPSPETLSISDTSEDDSCANKSINDISEIKQDNKHMSDQEDGEIVDESDTEKETTELIIEEKESNDNPDASNLTVASDHSRVVEDNVEKTEQIEKVENKLPIHTEDSVGETSLLDNEKEKNIEINKTDNELDDDPNDDIISLEGGDLVNEMKEHLKENKPTKRRLKSKKHRSKKRTDKRNSRDSIRSPIDIINLDEDSSTEENQNIC